VQEEILFQYKLRYATWPSTEWLTS